MGRSGRPAAQAATPHDVSVSTARVTRRDLVTTDRVDGTLGFAATQPIVDRLPGTYTSVPAEGDVIAPGGALFAIDDEPVLLLAGALPAWRPFGAGMPDGPDVAQLKNGLRGLGVARGLPIVADAHFDAATATAISRWQHGLGLPETGALELGRVAFLPGPVRVGRRHVQPGDQAQPGQAPFDATSTDRVVSVALDAVKQAEAVVGAHVSIVLPGGSVPGQIAAVGSVAAPPADIGQGSGSQTPQVVVTIRPDDPAATGQVDQEPVQVELTVDAHRNVLAVPVTALVAVGSDGEAVEVAGPGGARTMIPVRTGLASGGWVEVQGAGITEGTTVVVGQ